MASISGSVLAESKAASTTGSPTRAEFKADRDAFLKSHHWDEMTEDWLPNSGTPEAPASTLTRAEAKVSRDAFLSRNRWVSEVGWVLIKPQPRVMSTLTREQVRAETQEFMRTHRYNATRSTWQLRSAPRMQ